MSDDSPDRPFLWSEIHSIAKERMEQLDKTIRAEIGRPKSPIPAMGADRHQFFLLLAERADKWADRTRDTALECLKEIGRKDSANARSSVWDNGLRFFFSDNLRSFLHLACGCYVERYYRHPGPKQPRTYTSLEIHPDIEQQIGIIVERAKARISSEFKVNENWLVNMNRLLDQLRTGSQLSDPHSNTIPKVAKKSQFEISEDCRTVYWNGSHYPLTRNQGAMIELLRRAYESGKPAVSKDRLLGSIGNETSEVRDSWRRSPLWRRLIFSPKKGFTNSTQTG
jgi:hypothetical protein